MALKTRRLPWGRHGGLNTETEKERRCSPISLVGIGTHASWAKGSLTTAPPPEHFFCFARWYHLGTGVCQKCFKNLNWELGIPGKEKRVWEDLEGPE